MVGVPPYPGDHPSTLGTTPSTPGTTSSTVGTTPSTLGTTCSTLGQGQGKIAVAALPKNCGKTAVSM